MYEGQQLEALDKIRAWLEDKNSSQTFVLHGVAGSGKTTMAKEVSTWTETVAVAYTGKASLELEKRDLNSMTIHSFCYIPRLNTKTGEMEYFMRDSVALPELIILDECGMVDSELNDDLTSFGVKMLVMGDPYQIGAFSGKSPYDDVVPDYNLTEIHRQALDNPVIWLSREIREGNQLAYGKYGESAIVSTAVARKNLDKLLLRHLGESKTIVGTNATRSALNNHIRKLLGFSGPYPEVGEILICLKNEKTRGLVNGQIWEVDSVSEPFIHTCKYSTFNRMTGEQVEKTSFWSEGEPGKRGTPVTVEAVCFRLKNQDTGNYLSNVIVPVAFFNGNAKNLHWKQRSGVSEFDYGNCLTAHKGQGSTFKDVFVVDESYVFPESRRWLYSACTRPSNNLILATDI